MLGHWRGLHNRQFLFFFQKFEEKIFVEVNKTVRRNGQKGNFHQKVVTVIDPVTVWF